MRKGTTKFCIPVDDLKNLSNKELVAKYGVSYRTLYRYKHAAGMELRECVRYTARPDVLTEWNAETAYVVGVFAADGCIHNAKSSSLGSIDEGWLGEIAKLLFEGGRPLWQGSGNKVLGMGPVLTHRLIDLGMTPRKSLTLLWPSIPKEFEGHFIRGYFDGDGTVYTSQPLTHKTPRLCARFYTGSVRFADALQGCLESHAIDVSRAYATCYHITIANEASLGVLYHLMYARGGLYMARKKKVFDTFWALDRTPPGRPTKEQMG